jgi:hypothetical protein
MKILVCGGRKYGTKVVDNKTVRDIEEIQLLTATLDKYKNDVSLIIQGGASGADTLAALWAYDNGIPYKEYKAEWSKYGKAAGTIRNETMLLDSNPDLVIAFPGGSGTSHMIRFARNEGYNVIEIRPE